jgi:hypothetical protein
LGYMQRVAKYILDLSGKVFRSFLLLPIQTRGLG